MKIAIMQPYFMPYIGYFQLIKAVDKYVVYDDVNYIKGGWVSRNNILMNGERKIFTIALNGASPNKLFNEIDILDDFKKFERTLQGCYARATYYKETIDLLQRIFSYPNKNLAVFLFNSYQEILDYLSITTKLLLSSNLEKNNSLRGKEKVIEICKLLGADNYINAIGGQELYNKQEFQTKGIKLDFLKTGNVVYSQFKKDFVSNLSIIDVLMFNSPEEVNKMLDQYELI
jgi:hypothetical protein